MFEIRILPALNDPALVNRNYMNAATYPFLYCGRLIDFRLSLYFITY